MTRKYWGILSGVALVFSLQNSFAGEAWLVITSDPSGAAVFVDGTYRGATPQRPGDALRIQVSKGVREVDARVWVNGKEYVARQIVGARDRENFVQLNLREEAIRASVAPTVPPVQAGKPQSRTVIPFGELEVPGRNF